MLLLAGCSSGSESDQRRAIAKDVCAELEVARVFEVSGIIAKGRARILDEVGTNQGYMADLEAECPHLIAAVNAIEDATREQENLPRSMTIEVTQCTAKYVRGTVTNNSKLVVDVFIEGFFYDSNGIQLDDSLDSVNSLRPGTTAQWEAPFLGRGDVARCRAEVGSVFEQTE